MPVVKTAASAVLLRCSSAVFAVGMASEAENGRAGGAAAEALAPPPNDAAPQRLPPVSRAGALEEEAAGAESVGTSSENPRGCRER